MKPSRSRGSKLDCGSFKQWKDDRAKHTGDLVQYKTLNGKTLLVCRRCRETLTDLIAFMNRRLVGPKQSLMVLPKKPIQLSLDNPDAASTVALNAPEMAVDFFHAPDPHQ